MFVIQWNAIYIDLQHPLSEQEIMPQWTRRDYCCSNYYLSWYALMSPVCFLSFSFKFTSLCEIRKVPDIVWKVTWCSHSTERTLNPSPGHLTYWSPLDVMFWSADCNHLTRIRSRTCEVLYLCFRHTLTHRLTSTHVFKASAHIWLAVKWRLRVIFKTSLTCSSSGGTT